VFRLGVGWAGVRAQPTAVLAEPHERLPTAAGTTPQRLKTNPAPLPHMHTHTTRRHSTFDDPGLPSALLPWWLFWQDHQHEKMRWTMCAHDVCFKNELLR